jgi:hypothetical protein
MRTLTIVLPSLFAACLAAADVVAQGADEARGAVDQLFRGMRMGNAAIARRVLAPDVRFAVLHDSSGSQAVAVETLDQFLRAVDVSAGAWNEQIYDLEVRVDDTVASVWAPYTFYLSGRISHCGVNSIELLKDAEGWKITQITDTQRMEACPDPLGGQARGLGLQRSGVVTRQ